jgi:hypothetical protein
MWRSKSSLPPTILKNAEFYAFVQARSNFLGQSRAIAGIHEREEVVVLAGETPSLKTKKRIHLGVPSHDFFAYIPIIRSDPRQIPAFLRCLR